MGLAGFGFGAAALDVGVGDAGGGDAGFDGRVVVAAVEVQGSDVDEQTRFGDRVEGRFEQADVVAVGTVDGPADGDAVALRSDGPLPAAFGAISGVGAGSFSAVGGLVQRPVQGDLGEIEADEAIERGQCFVVELVEHAGVDPFVTTGSQRGVRYLLVEDGFDVDP